MDSDHINGQVTSMTRAIPSIVLEPGSLAFDSLIITLGWFYIPWSLMQFLIAKYKQLNSEQNSESVYEALSRNLWENKVILLNSNVPRIYTATQLRLTW